MKRTTAAIAVTCLATAAVALPSAASARTKTVYTDAPPSAQKALSKYGAAVNSYFLPRVAIHKGDSVKFVMIGFHTVDLPGASGHDLPLVVPTGTTATGVKDFAGNPFWFNGKVPDLGINPALVARSGPSKYNGSQRIDSGLPLSPKTKPLVVKFTKLGVYKYFCDVHPGMIGYVVVKAQGKPVPSAAQDAGALAQQTARAEKSAKKLAKTRPAANTVSLGASASNGVEDYAMFPASLSVKAGTIVTFFMSKDSREVHTASFGPSSYLTKMANSLVSPAPEQQAWYPSDDPALGPPVVSPAVHGNGFVNTGILDQDRASTTIPSSGQLKFTTPGTYHYICLIHPFMRGTIVVKK